MLKTISFIRKGLSTFFYYLSLFLHLYSLSQLFCFDAPLRLCLWSVRNQELIILYMTCGLGRLERSNMQLPLCLVVFLVSNWQQCYLGWKGQSLLPATKVSVMCCMLDAAIRKCGCKHFYIYWRIDDPCQRLVAKVWHKNKTHMVLCLIPCCNVLWLPGSCFPCPLGLDFYWWSGLLALLPSNYLLLCLQQILSHFNWLCSVYHCRTFEEEVFVFFKNCYIVLQGSDDLPPTDVWHTVNNYTS